MELYSWSPDHGLAAWDQETLAIHTYCVFAGVPLSTRYTDNPFWTPNGRFPLFKHKDEVSLTDFDAVVKYLSRRCNFNVDYNLSPKQKSDSVALNKLLEDKLLPALVYTLYTDSENFDLVFRPMLAKRLKFPLSFVYIPRYLKEARKLCESHVGNGEDEVEKALMESVFFTNAQECLEVFSQRLADQKFLFGEQPSSLDALLYSYLAPVTKLPLPNNRIKLILDGQLNLTAYVDNISKSYFPRAAGNSLSGPSKGSQSNEEDSSPTKQSVEAAKQQRMGNFWALLFAVTAMSGYAYTSGLYNAFRNIDVFLED